jgi:tetratricopeptide (TPR) repeat protein
VTSKKLLLSAAMIVRNEERYLEKCLQSIRDLADEIVIVDTGSEDGSATIARRNGARVTELAWCDDFSAARNHGLGLCRGDWILYIDADERARPYPRSELVAALADPNLAGCSVMLHARTGYTAYREMRLFRNHPRIRFEGLMHETIWPGIARYLEEEGGEIGECGLVLDHLGYDGPQKDKHERNLPLLEKALAADPDHVYCWYHLGIVHLGLGRPESARQAWLSGIDAVRRKQRRWATDSLPFVELIQHLLATGGDAGALLEEARLLFPDEQQLVWLEGHRLMRDGRLEEAVRAFEELLHELESGRVGADIGYDRRQYTSSTYAAIASCCYRLGRYGDAGRYFAVAERHEPDSLEYRTKRLLCEHLARSTG